ncbi:MAG TPA: lysylphosphatidylglycerol synthase transmembrane domain-containing protein [Tepidisphaeraceae bacterium]|jgi:hypothetical protein
MPDAPAHQSNAKHVNAGRKWLLFLLRWTIAVVGIYWVVANISMHDRVLVTGSDGWPTSVRLADETKEGATHFRILSAGGETRDVSRTELVARTDRQKITLKDGRKLAVLGLKVTEKGNRATWPIIASPPRNLWQRYWDVHNGPARLIQPGEVAGKYTVDVPYPLIDRGLLPMIRDANRWKLSWALVIFPLTFIITSLRWHELLKIVEINMGAGKAFVVTMVGAFYNTFMPGSTGGDVLKAYYAAKLAPDKRTRAVVSVIVDRAIGLLALIILGGSMAGYVAWREHTSPSPNSVVLQKCLQVAIGSLVIITCTGIGLIILYKPALRRLTGVDFITRRLPMQTQLAKAKEAIVLYRRNPLRCLATMLVTFPVHITVIVSATFAGSAFGLPLAPWYYWVVVPVIVLAGSIPISPQGAGVMEFFAILLTKPQGATVSQAFALTMSIRLVQIFWNLTGGIFVIRGGYHAPSEKESQDMDNTGLPASFPSPGTPGEGRVRALSTTPANDASP